MNITGLDHAPSIPVGAQVTAVTWHIAGLYFSGETYPTEYTALTAAIREREDAEAKNRVAHTVDGPLRYATSYLPLPERVTVDLRWTMTFPEAHGATSRTEFVVRRVTYETLADARAHANRLLTYRVSA